MIPNPRYQYELKCMVTPHKREYFFIMVSLLVFIPNYSYG